MDAFTELELIRVVLFFISAFAITFAPNKLMVVLYVLLAQYVTTIPQLVGYTAVLVLFQFISGVTKDGKDD